MSEIYEFRKKCFTKAEGSSELSKDQHDSASGVLNKSKDARPRLGGHIASWIHVESGYS